MSSGVTTRYLAFIQAMIQLLDLLISPSGSSDCISLIDAGSIALVNAVLAAADVLFLLVKASWLIFHIAIMLALAFGDKFPGSSIGTSTRLGNIAARSSGDNASRNTCSA